MVLAPTSLLEDDLFSESCRLILGGAKPQWRPADERPTDGSDAQVTRPGDLQLAQAYCPWPKIHTWLLYQLD